MASNESNVVVNNVNTMKREAIYPPIINIEILISMKWRRNNISNENENRRKQ